MRLRFRFSLLGYRWTHIAFHSYASLYMTCVTTFITSLGTTEERVRVRGHQGSHTTGLALTPGTGSVEIDLSLLSFSLLHIKGMIPIFKLFYIHVFYLV